MLKIRKTVTYSERFAAESGPSSEPVTIAAVAAVLQNPWHGRGYVEDLRPEIKTLAKPLSEHLLPVLAEACSGIDRIAAYGKAAIAGSGGELEHASALIHTLRFGNVVRDAVGGKSYLSFTNVRGGQNATISIPLVNKDDSGQRGYFWTIQFAVSDAPGPDELVVALGVATGPRPNARIGDRYEDMKELVLD